MRCYLFRGGQIAAVRIFADGSEGSVIRKCRAAFEKRKHEFDGFEIWDDARFAYRYPEPLPNYANDGPNPNSCFYRLYLLAKDGRILGLHGFPAESDDAALEIAQLTFAACSDCAARFEVWHDARLTARGDRPSRMMLEQVVAHRQARAVELEEQIRDSRWAVASSKRLLGRLQALSR
jgi:hypothetical protein